MMVDLRLADVGEREVLESRERFIGARLSTGDRFQQLPHGIRIHLALLVKHPVKAFRTTIHREGYTLFRHATGGGSPE